MRPAFVPKVTENGWYPKLRPNGTHVVYGFWETHIANLETGVETKLLAPTGARLQSLGWLDNDYLILGTETGPAAIYKLALSAIVPVNGRFTVPESCNLNVVGMPAGFSWGNARGGHWGIGLAGLPYSMKDGLPFRKDRSQYGIYVAGDHLLTADLSRNYEIQHFVKDEFVREYQTDNSWVCNEQGDVITGYYGTVRCFPWGEGYVDATIAPWKTEGVGAVPLRTANGDLWVWTFTENGGEVLALGRRLVLQADGTRKSETEPIVVHNYVGASGASDVIVVGNDFVLASNDPKGRMEVRWVPVDSPREKLVKQYAIDPLPRPIWTGYVYAMSDKYGDNPTAPGNMQCVIEKDAVIRAVALGMKIGVPADLLHLVPANQLVSVSASGGTIEELEADIKKCQARRTELGLQCPIVAYLDKDDWPRLPNPQPDWYNPQAYCKLGEDFGAFKARIQRVMAKFPKDKGIVLMCQAYNTNKLHTEDLLPLQYVYPEMAREDARVVGIIWFSDGREDPILKNGGTRWNSYIREAHVATVKASPGTPALLLVTPNYPSVTIDSYIATAQDGEGARAVAKVGGVADRLQWLVRPKGTLTWAVNADNPASDLDHTYRLPVGAWEIGVRVQPGGAQTGATRVVTVTPKVVPPVVVPPVVIPPVVIPPVVVPPVVVPPVVPPKKLSWWQKLLKALGL